MTCQGSPFGKVFVETGETHCIESITIEQSSKLSLKFLEERTSIYIIHKINLPIYTKKITAKYLIKMICKAIYDKLGSESVLTFVYFFSNKLNCFVYLYNNHNSVLQILIRPKKSTEIRSSAQQRKKQLEYDLSLDAIGKSQQRKTYKRSKGILYDTCIS